MRVQCAPPSLVIASQLKPANSFDRSHGAKAIGRSVVFRAGNAGSSVGLTLIHCSLGYVIFVTPLPLEYTTSWCSGSGRMVPHSQPFTPFQSNIVTAPLLPRLRVRMAPVSCWVA